jgi:hypothetical protein
MIVAVFLCLCLSQPDHSHSHFTRWPCSLLTSNISVSTPRPAFSALATEPHRTAPLPLLQPNIDTASPPAPPATNKPKKYAHRVSRPSASRPATSAIAKSTLSHNVSPTLRWSSTDLAPSRAFYRSKTDPNSYHYNQHQHSATGSPRTPCSACNTNPPYTHSPASSTHPPQSGGFAGFGLADTQGGRPPPHPSHPREPFKLRLFSGRIVVSEKFLEHNHFR